MLHLKLKLRHVRNTQRHKEIYLSVIKLDGQQSRIVRDCIFLQLFNTTIRQMKEALDTLRKEHIMRVL